MLLCTFMIAIIFAVMTFSFSLIQIDRDIMLGMGFL